MARAFGPFDNQPMYETVNRRMQRLLAQATSHTGFANLDQGRVTAGTGAQLVIAAYPDGALVDGLYVENPTTETVTTPANTNTNPRINRLVMRLDMNAKTIAPFVHEGTASTSPQSPTITQTADVFDMPLCRFTMPGSGSAQNPSSIVDERLSLSAVASGALSLTGNYQAASVWGAPKWVRRGQEMSLQGTVTNAVKSYEANAGQEYQIGTLPDGTQPGETKAFSVAYGNGAAFAGAMILVRPDRQVRFRSYVRVDIADIGLLSLSLAGAAWTIGL